MVKSVIFDMDGVLVNSEPAMRRAGILALKEYGVTAVDEDFMPFTGAGEDRFIGGVAELHGKEYVPEMKARAYEIYVDIAEEWIDTFEGIPEMINKLHDMGYSIAIASAADDIKVETNIRVAGINRELISALVTGNQVKNKKPSPDAFLLAAKKLGTRPENCVVIEDAVNGIQAACNAKMKSIGILSTFSSDELLKSGADRVTEKTKNIVEIIPTL